MPGKRSSRNRCSVRGWGCGGSAERESAGGRAFTLLEVLVSTAVFALLVGFLFVAVNDSTRIFQRANDQMATFQEARTAFDMLTRSLRSATLNTYWDYDNVNNPQKYIRQSDLHFVLRPGSAAGVGKDGVFFQSASSYNEDNRPLTGLLNTCGFFVEYGPDNPPAGVLVRDRYRLKQILLPGSQMTAFSSTNATDFGWFTGALAGAVSLGENIILLRIWPRMKEPLNAADPGSDSLSDSYSYNSRTGATASPQPITANQMPPLLDVTMVAIEESSAKRLAPGTLDGILNGLFEVSKQADYEADLATLETGLKNAQPPIAYRVFRATVPVAESKWSP